jgi:hypothetical protein
VQKNTLAILSLALGAALSAAIPAYAQSGLRVPQRGESGLDPALARGGLAVVDPDRVGFATHSWREAVGLAPSSRMQLSYSFGDRGSLGMSYISGRESEYDARQYSLFGRYWFAHDWAVSAEALSRDTPGLLRLNDFRIGFQRRF